MLYDFDETIEKGVYDIARFMSKEGKRMKRRMVKFQGEGSEWARRSICRMIYTISEIPKALLGCFVL